MTVCFCFFFFFLFIKSLQTLTLPTYRMLNSPSNLSTMVSNASSSFNRKRSVRRSSNKKYTLKDYTDYLAEHQIGMAIIVNVNPAPFFHCWLIHHLLARCSFKGHRYHLRRLFGWYPLFRQIHIYRAPGYDDWPVRERRMGSVVFVLLYKCVHHAASCHHGVRVDSHCQCWRSREEEENSLRRTDVDRHLLFD